MNCCTTSNSYLWILIILLLLGTQSSVLSSSAFTGAGWPMLIAALYVLSKNGTLASFFNSLGGCNNYKNSVPAKRPRPPTRPGGSFLPDVFKLKCNNTYCLVCFNR